MAQKPKISPIGIRAATKPRLLRVCRHRGWSQAEAIDRMVQQELATIARERTTADSSPETKENVAELVAHPS